MVGFSLPRRRWGLAVLLAAAAVLAGCTDERPLDAPYQTGPASSGGTGRYYLGREIAAVQGHREADRFDRSSRTTEEFPDRVVQALDLRPSDVVADVGAGTGFFTFRLSEEVPRGRVYAVDIDEGMLTMLRERAEAHGAANVVPTAGTVTDPRLPQGAVDVALIVDAYHEFSHPREMVRNLIDALAPGGRIVIVEYRAEDPTLPVDPLHTMSEAQVIREMEAAGLELRRSKDFLPQQHFLVFAQPTV